MRQCLRFIGNEARAFALLVPLLLVSALAGIEATASIAASGFSDSPISPLSPLPASTPTGALASGLDGTLLVVLAVALILIVVAGIILWRRRSVR